MIRRLLLIAALGFVMLGVFLIFGLPSDADEPVDTVRRSSLETP